MRAKSRIEIFLAASWWCAAKRTRNGARCREKDRTCEWEGRRGEKRTDGKRARSRLPPFVRSRDDAYWFLTVLCTHACSRACTSCFQPVRPDLEVYASAEHRRRTALVTRAKMPDVAAASNVSIETVRPRVFRAYSQFSVNTPWNCTCHRNSVAKLNIFRELRTNCYCNYCERICLWLRRSCSKDSCSVLLLCRYKKTLHHTNNNGLSDCVFSYYYVSWWK